MFGDEPTPSKRYNPILGMGKAVMVKLMILFRQPADIVRFEDSYNTVLALIERIPDVLRRQVVSVTGSPTGGSVYYRILETYFDSQDSLAEALRSKPGQEAGGELSRLPAGSFEVVFADVYEERGGSTPQGA
jgi:uncharacterized protein (TIGR02118 family)